jgi:hypothetical protein
MKILGYKYKTEVEALQAVTALNEFSLLPKNKGVSKFELSMFNTWGGGYWTRENKEWYEPVLGKPYKFEVPDEPLTK